MIGWIFAGITLGAALMATFVSPIRRAILALWVVGLGVGAIYLTVGAEFLAIIQWIVSTLVTISFVFFSVMFGEYNPPKEQSKKSASQGVLLLALSVILGLSFSAIIWLGAESLPETAFVVEPKSGDLSSLGRVLTHENLLSLEVLALTLFLVLVGGGVVARFEGSDPQ